MIGTSPDVEAAAAIIGTDAAIGDQVTWFQAFGPIDGVDTTIGPVITAGRAPTSVDEIALGATTMADQGVSIGDTVELRTVNTNAAVTELTVVGTTIINDGFEDNPGRGGVVTVEWIEENGEEWCRTRSSCGSAQTPICSGCGPIWRRLSVAVSTDRSCKAPSATSNVSAGFRSCWRHSSARWPSPR